MNEIAGLITVIVLLVFFGLPKIIWHYCRRCHYSVFTVKSNPLCKQCKYELKEGLIRWERYDIDYLVKRRLEDAQKQLIGDNQE